MDDDVAEYLKCGADMVILKPMNMTHLSVLLSFVGEQGTKSSPNKKLKILGDKVIETIVS